MGSHQVPGHGVSGAGMPHSFPPSLALPEWMVYPLKLNSSNSPSSPLSSQYFDEALMSSFLDLHASAEATSGRCLSQSSSLETGNSSASNSPVFTSEPVKMQQTIQNLLSGQAERHALEEIETILMSPDAEDCRESKLIKQTDCSKSRPISWQPESSLEFPQIQQQYISNKYQKTCHSPHLDKRCREIPETTRTDIRGLLIGCAKAISENRLSEFEILANQTEAVVSINGDPMQRLGAYLLEGLKARQEASGTTIYRSLHCWETDSSALLTHMQVLYDICPYFKFGYMAANGAIAEAIRNENHVHIIDFQIAQGTQWLTLIQALAARPGGPPRVRITGIDDPVSRLARGDSLKEVGTELMALAERFNIPLEFHHLPVFAADVTRDMLDIRPGEAVAVNFAFHLHHTPDESVDVNNPRDGLLRMVKGLSPKVTTLVEQESNMNTTPFLTRFMEALEYYHAMFESIHESPPRDQRDRINVEQHCLAKDIVNIIACEGKDRVERHELLGKWRSRLSMAGFRPYPLSSYVNSVIRSLLRCYSDRYTLVEKDGSMLLGWKNRHLISASAWH